MTHKDIPSRQDIEALAAVRTPYSVSIYTPTGTLSSDAERAKIEVKNQFRDAATQLQANGAPAQIITRLDSILDQLLSDLFFWTYQAQSLAIFINEDTFDTYRLPNRITATVDVADRFYIKPLMRTITFSQSAFVLALSKKQAKLIRVSADQPATVVEVPDMPENLDSFINLDPSTRHTDDRGDFDMGVYEQQYAAAVNKAVYPVVRDTKLPLILASAEPLASAYRRANSYKYLSAQSLNGNPEAFSDQELAERTRPILDEIYRAEVAEVKNTFKAREAQFLGSSDLDIVAKGAARHAIDTLLVDIDTRVPGYLEDDGTVTRSEDDDASNYGVVDEVLRRALLVNARVYAVRADEMPDGAKVAATFRFSVS